jgi:methylmalonyl-CoA mutase cobalamin-binding domain/chain
VKIRHNEVFVPELLLAARAMKRGMETLDPYLNRESVLSRGTFIVGTVKGDLHDIGKNLVAMMVGSAGFDVVDLGVDVAPEDYVKAVRDNPGAKIVVGLSALLTTTMPAMQETVAALRSAGFDNKVNILVGGAPITAEFAAEIGADAYSPDAASAVQAAKQMVS